ncbi:TatD family hydrolase [Sphingobium sufflavum]|uniref:Qat anti-phage system TatD family nuclease QatD n=1 Tax=Sphingobium sufflavum TaxID=1129547 RepID=UPI001F16CF0F|nr:Qat anti-phage system TatD family nuclease QatD [Sphingobium sufflavum]MCE7798265.1 TatD family hydrolase [Sphingobium sufflavum]
MALIDFHCHLDLYPDPAATTRKAVEEGVYILSVTTTPSAFSGTSALAPAGSRIRTALGLHPELAASRWHELPLFHDLLPTVDYIGEVGLDGSPPHRDTLATQAAVLHEILDACAAAGGRTISLHSRGAAVMLLDMLEFEPLAGTFVLHWFSAKPAIIQRAADLGCWFSVGSAMMASRSGREAVNAMPIDRMLPETDGPFGMTQGVPLAPGGAGSVYHDFAELKGMSVKDAERLMTGNFRRLVARSSREQAQVKDR